MKIRGWSGRHVRQAAVAVAIAGLVLGGGGVAYADNAISDGDGVAPVGDSNMSFGTIPCGVASTKDAPVLITRNGNYATSNVFMKDTTATVTVTTTGGALSTVMASPNTIAIPSNWDTIGNNALAGPVGSTVTVTPTTTGAGSGTVTYTATGTKSDGTALVRTDAMTVTWNVATCAPTDSTPPVITPNVTGTVGSNGWYTSNVTLTWTVTENETPGSLLKTGCVNQNITADQAATTYSCSATSTGGSASQVDMTIKRDATAPTVNWVGTQPADGQSYDVGAVPASPTCNASDAMSGVTVAGCAVAGYSTGLGHHPMTAEATDNAGNVTTLTREYDVVDPTAPVITPTVDGTKGLNDWYVSDVDISWDVTDPDSPITSTTGCEATTVNTDTTGTTVTCSATSAGGTTSESVTIKRDTTAPTISADLDRAADVSGWFNIATGAPTVEFTCGDATSGVATCPTDFTFGEGTGLSHDGTVYDNAGNSANEGVSNVDVDLTEPTISAALDRSPAGSGWFNIATGAPTVEFTCSDALSGVVTCPDDFTFGEGLNLSHSGTVFDNAGNSANDGVTDVDVDLTAPTVTWVGALPADGATYDFGDLPATGPTCSATDALSGVTAAGCAVTNYLTTVGIHTVRAAATDTAGNTETLTRTYTVAPWTRTGFYQPVDMNGTWNTVKGGSTVPLKFEVFKGSTELTDTSAIKSFTQAIVPCGAGPLDAIEEVVINDTGGTTLRYDSTGGQFIQNWKTPKSPGICYRVTMTTQDAYFLQALFKLK